MRVCVFVCVSVVRACVYVCVRVCCVHLCAHVCVCVCRLGIEPERRRMLEVVAEAYVNVRPVRLGVLANACACARVCEL